jgi:hypothetical protein
MVLTVDWQVSTLNRGREIERLIERVKGKVKRSKEEKERKGKEI